MPLSPSAALYLGADAVAPQGKKLSLGVDVPGKDASVDLKSLSAVLAAAAVWSLRESGAVTVQLEQKKGLFGTKTRVAVRPAQGAQPRGAIEAGLLQSLDAKSPYAKEAVHGWLGRDTTNPWGNVVSAVEHELVQDGVLEPVEAQGMKGRLGQLAGARQKMSAVPQALAATRPEVDSALQRWFAFHQAEQQLAQALVKECRDGIDARLDTD